MLPTRQIPTPAASGQTDWVTQDSDRLQLDVVSVLGPVTTGASFSLSLNTDGSNLATVNFTATSADTTATVLANLATQIDGLSGHPYVATAADGYMTVDAGTNRASAFTVAPSGGLHNQNRTDANVSLNHIHNRWTVDALGHVSVSGQDVRANSSWSTQFNDDPGAPAEPVTMTTITSVGGQIVSGQIPPTDWTGPWSRAVTTIDAMHNATDSFYDFAGRLRAWLGRTSA